VSKSVFKFRAFNKEAIELLVNRQLWFARPDSLNDPFECPFEPAQMFVGLDTFDKLDDQVKHETKEAALATFNAMGICSFSRARKNQLMWAHYADEHKGFCIGFNESELKKVNGAIRAIDVRYQSELPSSQVLTNLEFPCKNSAERSKENSLERFHENSLERSTENSLELPSDKSFADHIDQQAYHSIIGTKYTNWQYERERRLVLPQSQALLFSLKSVTSIAFGLRMPARDKQTLKELLKGPQWAHVKWYQGEKSAGKFALDFNQLK